MSGPLGTSATILAFVSIVPVAAACSKRGATGSTKEQPMPSSASSHPETPAASASAPVADSSWCTGAWTGSYKAAAHQMDLPTNRGGIPDWKADDGKAFVGPGTLELVCSSDGTVSGSARGALGEQDVRGTSSGDSMFVRLVPRGAASQNFSGTLTLSRAGSEVTGDLRASSADGHVLRTGMVSLARGAER